MADHRIALTADIAEISRLIDWVETCCGADAVGGDTALKLALALEEAVANVIQHAFVDRPAPHRIEVRLAVAAQTVTALVIDNGRPFDPTRAPRPNPSLPLDRRDPGGLGVLLIRRMVDRVAYRRVDGRNRLRLEKTRG